MLPRINWRFSQDNNAMEKGRYRVNNAVASYVLRMGGLYIRYPEINRFSNLFATDGVHLSTVGNNIFLNKIQADFKNLFTVQVVKFSQLTKRRSLILFELLRTILKFTFIA